MACRELAKAIPDGFVLNKPAKVGSGTFGIGVKWSIVIGAAQRQFEYTQNDVGEKANIQNLKGILFDVPEGFVLVPKEPTQKMLNAGHVVMNPIKGSLVQAGTNQKRRDCYKAMIEAAQEPTPLKVGDLVEPKDYRYILASGACRYPYAYVVNTNPFQLMSEEGDMYWCRTVEVDGYKLLKSNVQLPKGVVDRMIREGLIAPVEAQEQANESE